MQLSYYILSIFRISNLITILLINSIILWTVHIIVLFVRIVYLLMIILPIFWNFIMLTILIVNVCIFMLLAKENILMAWKLSHIQVIDDWRKIVTNIAHKIFIKILHLLYSQLSCIILGFFAVEEHSNHNYILYQHLSLLF